MRRAAFLIPVLLLAACKVETKNPADADGNVTIEANTSGEVNFNLPFVNGKINLPEGAIHNSNFDIDGVKLMPGSSVTGFSLDAHNKGATVNMSFKAPASPDEVRSYYVDQCKKQGVEAALAGDAVTGKSKDGSPFTIAVSPAPGGSQGRIVVQDND